MSLPEQMALHEVLELEQGVRDALGRNLDLIVVNGRYPGRFSDDEAKQLRAMAEGATRAGLPRAVLAQHRRARVHAARVEWLARADAGAHRDAAVDVPVGDRATGVRAIRS